MAKKKVGLIRPCYLELKRLSSKNGNFLRSLECRVVLKRLTKSNKYYRRFLRRSRESRPKTSEIRKRHEDEPNHNPKNKAKTETRQNIDIECPSVVAKTSEIRKRHEDEPNNNPKSKIEKRQNVKIECPSKMAKTSEIKKRHEDEPRNNPESRTENLPNINICPSKVAKTSKISKRHEDQSNNNPKMKTENLPKHRSFSLSDKLFGSAFDPKYEKAKITKVTKIVRVKKVSTDTKEKKEKLERRLIKECHRRKVKVALIRLTKADLKLAERKQKVDKLRHYRIPKVTKTNQLEKSKPLDFNALPAIAYSYNGYAESGSVGKDVTAKPSAKKSVRFEDAVTVQEFIRESDLSLSTPTLVNSGQQLKAKSLNQYMKERHPTAIKSQSIANAAMVKKILDTFLSEVVLEIRWFCPICDHFDSVPCSEERYVKKHIAVQHGKSLLDLGIGALHGDYPCNYEQCYKLFTREEDLLTHISYDHKKLLQKVSVLGLNSSDYQPLSRSRKGKEIRWQCLRCPIKFASFCQLMLHLTLVHYSKIMSCHLQTGDVYQCIQVGCKLSFKTIPGLLIHEQIEHKAFEKFIGKIIGRNDLYEELKSSVYE